MKILVKSPKEEGEGEYTIKLWVPTSLLKTTFGIKLITKKTSVDESFDIQNEELRRIIRACYKELKHHRGLTLVEIDSADGDKVKITL